MNTSELFAVEYNRDQREWRIDTLDKVLEANYERFLGKYPLMTPLPPFGTDWILLGVCASLEEANALADEFLGIVYTLLDESSVGAIYDIISGACLTIQYTSKLSGFLAN